MAKSIRSDCPMCGTAGNVSASRRITPTCRVLYAQCPAPACGCQWIAELSATKVLFPGRAPDPRVRLEIPPEARAAALAWAFPPAAPAQD